MNVTLLRNDVSCTSKKINNFRHKTFKAYYYLDHRNRTSWRKSRMGSNFGAVSGRENGKGASVKTNLRPRAKPVVLGVKVGRGRGGTQGGSNPPIFGIIALMYESWESGWESWRSDFDTKWGGKIKLVLLLRGWRSTRRGRRRGLLLFTFEHFLD